MEQEKILTVRATKNIRDFEIGHVVTLDGLLFCIIDKNEQKKELSLKQITHLGKSDES